MSKPYSKEIKDFIIENHKGTSYKVMADMVNAKFNLNITPAKIRCFYGNHKLNSGLDGRFKKGNKSFNKGLKQTEYMSPEGIERSKATRFTKGHSPINYKPVGSERINVDGYIEVKVKDPNIWVHKQRVIWESVHGEIPKNHVVVF